MKRTLISLFFSLLFVFSYAQNLKFTIQGKVKDMYLGIPVKNANVKLTRSDGQVFDVLTNGNGFYKFDTSIVLENLEYTLIISGQGYLSSKSTESTKNYSKSTAFVHDFELWAGCRIPAPYYIPFDSLTDFNCYAVNTLFIALMDNPNIKIELISIQNQESDTGYELKLKNWLMESGINEERLSTSKRHLNEKETQSGKRVNHIQLMLIENE